ncbi:MAG: hypothetical protein LC121_00225 [Anaerolineae bacterium]|nr:hypothetical protein [Anaerolineae bacterium]
MAGLGFAPEPMPAPAPAAPARAPQLDVIGTPGPRAAAPLANLSTTQKIGALLQDFGRGVAGRPSFTQELLAQRQEQELLELKRMDVGVSAMTKGMELLKNTPAAQREAVAKQYGQMYEHLLPGFTETLAQAAMQPQATEEQLKALGEHGKTLIAIGGSVDEALKLAQNPAFMKQLNDASDARNAPEIVSALERGRDLMMQSPETKALWDQMTKDGLTLSDLMDPQFRDALGLTESHVNTIARSPELQSNLRPFGFKTTKDLDAEAGKELDQKYAKDPAAVAGAETAAREAAKIISYIGQDGTIIREPQGRRNELAAQGFRPLVTGRTEADAAAINKELTKYEAGQAVPIDPYLARLTGVDPTTTKADATAKGWSTDLTDAQIKQLQGAESAATNVSKVIGQMRTIVEQNPEANTRVAALGGLATNIKAEVEALGKSTGLKIDVDREVGRFEQIWKSNGIDNALMKQLAISLAYMNAKGMDDNGRLSDADVRNSAKALGAGNSSPDILLNLLDSAELQADNNLRTQTKTLVGADIPSRLPDVQAAETIQRRADAGETITPEEIQALTPRALRHLQSLRSKARK